MNKAFKNAAKQLSFFIVLAFLLALTVSAQETLTGTWKADTRNEKAKKWDDESSNRGERIHISFERRTEKGGKNNHGSSFYYSDLQGLTKEQASGSGTVKFSLAREAGTIDCDGNFADGKGTGTFRFTPKRSFINAMKSRGFDFEKSSKFDSENQPMERLFAATTLNVTTALADDLLSANFGKLEVDDLFKAAIFKIDSKFMREMKASGFPNLTFEDLVKARIFKIDAEFVRKVAEMGFTNEPFESLVKMQIFKVTPEFIAEVRNEGLTNLEVEDLVKMRIFKIDGAFIRQARADGIPLEVEKLVQKRIGVYNKN